MISADESLSVFILGVTQKSAGPGDTLMVTTRSQLSRTPQQEQNRFVIGASDLRRHNA